MCHSVSGMGIAEAIDDHCVREAYSDKVGGTVCRGVFIRADQVARVLGYTGAGATRDVGDEHTGVQTP